MEGSWSWRADDTKYRHEISYALEFDDMCDKVGRATLVNGKLLTLWAAEHVAS